MDQVAVWLLGSQKLYDIASKVEETIKCKTRFTGVVDLKCALVLLGVVIAVLEKKCYMRPSLFHRVLMVI